jgi:hypothetical protein
MSSSFSLPVECEAATMPDNCHVGHWSIGLYEGEGLNSLTPRNGPNPIITAAHFAKWSGIGAADPFAVRREDAWYLFFELFLQDKANAVIGAARSENLRDWEAIGIVLQQSHHLSYPFVFEHEGEIYMMPESKSVGRVDIFRAIEFPHRWVFEKTILRGKLMDCSMIYHSGRYWLFAGWRSYWLRLFYASSPLGPFKSHWLPTIRKYSKSSTRPGGRPIHHNGHLIRFSQDNQRYYGQQLRAWNVTRMNRFQYAEKPLFEEPILKGSGSGWNARCMHHIDAYSTENLPGMNQPCSEFIAFVDGCV